MRPLVRMRNHVLQEPLLQLVADSIGRSGARRELDIEEVVMDIAQQHIHQRALDEIGQRDALDGRGDGHPNRDFLRSGGLEPQLLLESSHEGPFTRGKLRAPPLAGCGIAGGSQGIDRHALDRRTFLGGALVAADIGLRSRIENVGPVDGVDAHAERSEIEPGVRRCVDFRLRIVARECSQPQLEHEVRRGLVRHPVDEGHVSHRPVSRLLARNPVFVRECVSVNRRRTELPLRRLPAGHARSRSAHRNGGMTHGRQTQGFASTASCRATRCARNEPSAGKRAAIAPYRRSAKPG